jgi:hypothetical protein
MFVNENENYGLGGFCRQIDKVNVRLPHCGRCHCQEQAGSMDKSESASSTGREAANILG